MSSKIFTKNKKRFFLAIFAMAVLVLGFWAANIPISNAAEEIYCTTSIANDYANDCESNAENCTFCNDVCADGTRCVSTCTVNPYNYNLESGTPAYTALNACASDSAAFPYTRKCRAGACPDSNDKVTTSGLGLADGDGCVVRVLDGTTVKSASGAWDASEKKCVICYDAAGNDKKDPFVCGSSSGINLTQTSVTPNIWNCTGVGTNKLEAACGLTSPTKCDEKDVEDTCDPGKTCDALGACVAANALTLDVSWSANPVTVSANSTATFTVKKASDSTAVSGATVTVTSISCTAGTGTLPNPASVTNASGQTTSTFTAPAVGSTCTINAKAVLTGYTDGVITTSISATTCTGSNFSQYDYYRYAKGDSLELAGFNPDGSGNWYLCFYNGSNTRMEENQYSADFTPNTEYYTATTTGVWKGLAVAGTGGCPGTYDASQGCPCSTDVVECEDDSDCASNNCNLSTYTCVAAAATPNCDQLSCGGAVSNQPCMCRAQLVSANGDYCCATSDYYGDETTCKNASNCNIADPPPGCTPNGCGGGCPASCTGADDPDCPGACLDATCVTDTDCAAAIPAATCSGPGMFVSPLGPGYCTIGEILTNATNWILALVASIIILIIVIGGLMYISSSGDEEKLRTSKNIIFYAVIGLGIILISYALITEVTDILKGP